MDDADDIELEAVEPDASLDEMRELSLEEDLALYEEEACGDNWLGVIAIRAHRH